MARGPSSSALPLVQSPLAWWPSRGVPFLHSEVGKGSGGGFDSRLLAQSEVQIEVNRSTMVREIAKCLCGTAVILLLMMLFASWGSTHVPFVVDAAGGIVTHAPATFRRYFVFPVLVVVVAVHGLVLCAMPLLARNLQKDPTVFGLLALSYGITAGVTAWFEILSSYARE